MLFQGGGAVRQPAGLGERGLRPARRPSASRAASTRDKAERDAGLGRLGARGRPSLMPAELSGGMQKRVGLARAIAHAPEILFFDEPTTGLDPIMADVINELIVRCVKQLGATALSITHDMASVRKIADRVAMLYGGRIVWQGPVGSIDASGSPFVDQFIHGRAEGPIRIGAGTITLTLCLVLGGRIPHLTRRQSHRPRPDPRPNIFVCQSCGAAHARMGRALRRLRRLEQHRRGGDGEPGPGAGGKSAAAGGSSCAARRQRRPRRRASPAASTSSTACWAAASCRAAAMLIGGDPGIGKSTLMLQAAAAIARTAARWSMSAARSRSTRSGCARSASGWRERRCSSPRHLGRDILATVDQPSAPALLIIDSIQTMWVDGLEQAPGTVTQLRAAGQALIRFAKQRGSRAAADRPRHQGRPDRRPARARAHGRRRALLRGRARPPVPDPARGQEPLWPGQRDRRVRDGRGRPRAGAQPFGPVPGRPRGRRRRRRGVRRHGGHAAAAGRDPGAGGAQRRSPRRAAPWSAGTAAGWPCCWPCSRRAAAL